MNYSQILKKGTSILKQNFVKNPKLDGEILLANVLKIKREDLLMNLDNKIKSNEIKFFYDLIYRRKKKNLWLIF
tara:strand:+ start:264 stop:485 length:222 start_codon:yes stop_codon:yes gene_type:complete